MRLNRQITVQDRISMMLTMQLVAGGMDAGKAKLKSTEQFAVECAILKVWGSEALDYVVDEGVQIYGGMGFSADAPMDRAYRDARINRIFEGTNEINRLLTVDMMLKRAMKGELDLMTPATAVAAELMCIPDFGEEDDTLFAAEKKIYSKSEKSDLNGSWCCGSEVDDEPFQRTGNFDEHCRYGRLCLRGGISYAQNRKVGKYPWRGSCL